MGRHVIGILCQPRTLFRVLDEVRSDCFEKWLLYLNFPSCVFVEVLFVFIHWSPEIWHFFFWRRIDGIYFIPANRVIKFVWLVFKLVILVTLIFSLNKSLISVVEGALVVGSVSLPSMFFLPDCWCCIYFSSRSRSFSFLVIVVKLLFGSPCWCQLEDCLFAPVYSLSSCFFCHVFFLLYCVL